MDTSEEFGTLSTLTDDDGRYFFEDVPKGTYRVNPNLTGYTFEPPTVSVGSGSSAPILEAIPVETKDERCAKTSKVSDILESDRKGRELLLFTLQEADNGIDAVRRSNVDQKAADALARSLERASLLAQRSYTTLLRRSERLPKIVSTCTSTPSCRRKVFTRDITAYRAHLDNLRKLAFFVVRRTRETLSTGLASLSNKSAIIRRLHRDASVAAKKLPKKSDKCS